MRKPTVAITMGDPAGVGPEVCLRLLQDASVAASVRCVVFGDARVLEECSRAVGVHFDAPVLRAGESRGGKKAPWSLPQTGGHCVVDWEVFERDGFAPGVVSAQTGAAAFFYVERGIEAALDGRVDAIATAPIHKEALYAAGIRFPGHTEIFAARTGAEKACMFQYSDEVRASFVTTHVGYAEVPALLTRERIVDVIALTADAMRRIRGSEPRMVVLGLNPHAGEHGLFGAGEEERLIAPAVEEAKRRGYSVEGPIPPDTAFIPAKRRSTDAFVCMYHDQGHIPLKALAFDSAVNTTLGLPIVRTSVDHGTACDIAWTGKAHPGSLIAAVHLAARLSRTPGNPQTVF
jgi:4-hydroxythreonine-4-phosphate dehydrogenase